MCSNSTTKHQFCAPAGAGTHPCVQHIAWQARAQIRGCLISAKGRLNVAPCSTGNGASKPVCFCKQKQAVSCCCSAAHQESPQQDSYLSQSERSVFCAHHFNSLFQLLTITEVAGNTVGIKYMLEVCQKHSVLRDLSHTRLQGCPPSPSPACLPSPPHSLTLSHPLNTSSDYFPPCAQLLQSKDT